MLLKPMFLGLIWTKFSGSLAFVVSLILRGQNLVYFLVLIKIILVYKTNFNIIYYNL